jgi:hypothetical protein
VATRLNPTVGRLKGRFQGNCLIMTSASLLTWTIPHLKIDLSPQAYHSLRGQYRVPAGTYYNPDYEDAPEFWKRFPEYLIARCPICEACYTECVDTYALHNWTLRLEETVYYGVQSIGCAHFVGVKTFINLNGIEPTEEKYFSNVEGEIPYVMPVYLPEDIPSHAVLHSLPICREEHGVFVPRYSVFMVTYYSAAPRLLHDRNGQYWKPGMGLVSLMFPFTKDRDLLRWVAAGKLWWLDLEQDQLPLRSDSLEAFPYANIEGRREGYVYRRPGKFTRV